MTMIVFIGRKYRFLQKNIVYVKIGMICVDE